MFLEDNILILQLSCRKLFPPVQDDPYEYGSVLEEACQRSLQIKKNREYNSCYNFRLQKQKESLSSSQEQRDITLEENNIP